MVPFAGRVTALTRLSLVYAFTADESEVVPVAESLVQVLAGIVVVAPLASDRPEPDEFNQTKSARAVMATDDRT